MEHAALRLLTSSLLLLTTTACSDGSNENDGAAGQGGSGNASASTGGTGNSGTGGSGNANTGGSGNRTSGAGGSGNGGSSTGGTSGGGTGNRGGGGGSPPNGCAVEIPTDDNRIPQDIAQLYLDIHNQKRVDYCLEPLVWDCNLALVAQAYAERGAWYLPHNPNRSEEYADLVGCTSDCPRVGENIHWHTPWDFFDLETSLDGWLDEESDAPGCYDGGAHYTQMVRPHATALGCGIWIDPNDELHLVCNYLNDGANTDPPTNCPGC